MRRIKQILVVVMTLALVLTGCSSKSNEAPKGNAGATPEKTKLKVAFVMADKIGINPFYQMMDQGLKKAAQEFDIETKVIESKDWGQIEENLRAVAADKKWDLIFTNSFESVDALTKVAADLPNQKFAIVNATVDAPNVRSLNFKEHEGAYLLGAAAGMISKTGKVGAVGPLDIPFLHRWSEGAELGLKSINPNATYSVSWIGGFTDVPRGKELALQEANKGADVVLGLAAAANLGVIEAAKEKGFLTSGIDVDQSSYAPDHVFTSDIKRADVVVYTAVKELAEGKWAPGLVEYGLKEGGVGLSTLADPAAPRHPQMTDEVVNKLKEIEKKIIAGEIVVPDPLKK